MAENEQQEKQNFLRQNILEKGYDGDEFVQFLITKKGEGASDISNWSMNDLQEVVKEFVSNHNNENNKEIEPQNNQPQSQSQTEPQTKSQAQPQAQPQEQNQDIVKDYVIIESDSIGNNENDKNQKNKISTHSLSTNDENFGIVIPEFIECQKSERNGLSDQKEIEILVTDPKIVSNGIFSKTTTFLITTNPVNLKVRRKHSDFVWLRERLTTIFNLNIIPRLPKKGKSSGDTHINKRMRNLQLFGKVKIEVTPQKEILLDKIRNNAIYNESILKQINENFKLLKLEMDATIKRICSFLPMFEKLMKVRKTYLPNNIICESYNQLKNIFESWSIVLKKQKIFFIKDVKEYLKLVGGNYTHLKTLTEFVDEQKNYYKKTSKNLIAKKMEIFEKYEIDDWQLSPKDKKNVKNFSKDKLTSYKKICYNSTEDAIKLKEKYGYQLNKIISEYNRLKSIMNKENKKKVMDFTNTQKQILYEHIIIMGKIIGIMDDCINEDNNNNENIVQNKIEITEVQDEENIVENNEENK